MKIKVSDIKKIVIPSIIIILLFSLIFTLITKNQIDNYSKIYNERIEEIIGQIKESYPDTDEKEIINIIQNKDRKSEGKDLLKKYGYYEDSIYLESIENELNKTIIINVIVVASLGILIMIVGLVYAHNQNKNIEEINS